LLLSSDMVVSKDEDSLMLGSGKRGCL
jgi:hypothetical protein